jgi:uncharacterized protein (DUF2252 family)
MMNSPFTFYRGAAINMAVDLATTPPWIHTSRLVAMPTSSIWESTPLPNGVLFFGANDLDETLPAPPWGGT